METYAFSSAPQSVRRCGNRAKEVTYEKANFVIRHVSGHDTQSHARERIGDGLYKNVPGNYDIGMFKSAVRYFNK